MNKPDTSQLCAQLLRRFVAIRRRSETLCEGLTSEDMQAQSMADASPTKWHLAHTSWAFETFFLKAFAGPYQVFDEAFEYLFNSYYNAIGEQYPRAARGLLTRPSLGEVMDYRQHVDRAVVAFLTAWAGERADADELDRFELCLHHEEQHQELMLTDLKHLLLQHPRPFFYRGDETLELGADPGFESFSADLHEIGAQGESFSFDNEGPRHRVYVEGFRIARSLVSNREYLAFVESGAYREPAHWLSEAWHLLQSKREQHPAYWRCHHGTWQEFTFAGWIDLEPNSPVRHLNFFEAQAFATWAGKRLPTEFEWEVAARSERPPLRQLYNQVWQWTSSAYAAYPGFRPLPGAVSEYNGKFMVNQYVLRGGSIATPPGHIRPSYRNFFYPTASWQFSGLRLAESI